MCAGYGGIGLGLKNIFGERLRTIAYCELEGFAQANLISKMEAGLLDVAPLWSDLKTFPYGSFHGLVDILIAGYPCQPFSAAGKRAGKDDPRHLWPFIADGIRLLQPRLCFFENVEGHISLGLREVIGELESIGYQTAWGIFSASEVGAPHQRKRVFILAYDQRQRVEELGRQIAVESKLNTAGDGGDAGGRELADTGRIEPQGWCGAADGQQSGAGRISRGEPAPRHDQVWPSRPGEPQHAWEPPRVVGGKLGDSTHQRDFHQTQQDNTEAGVDFDRTGEGERVAHAHGSRGEEPEHQQANLPTEPSGGNSEAMGNASGERCEQDAALRGEQQPSGIGEECGLGVAEAMGNALLTGSSPERPNRGQQDGLGQPSGGTMGNSNSPRPQEWTGQRGAGIQGTHADGGADAERQTQPAMGRDADGPARGMGYAELCVSCDNRTDELRLLGNGVVPATAERAFRVLTNELFNAIS